MQTAKIKVGEDYAYKRGPGHVRFHVNAIVTKKTTHGTSNQIVGVVLEDGRKPGSELTLDPADLLGPIAEYDELVKRKAAEEAERKTAADEREKQARADRLLLYKFIGETPPKDPKEYHQKFRASFGSVDINPDGKDALIKRIRAMQQE